MPGRFSRAQPADDKRVLIDPGCPQEGLPAGTNRDQARAEAGDVVGIDPTTENVGSTSVGVGPIILRDRTDPGLDHLEGGRCIEILNHHPDRLVTPADVGGDIIGDRVIQAQRAGRRGQGAVALDPEVVRCFT